MTIPTYYLEPATFGVDFADLHCVRRQVFIEEQRIPAELEFDEQDKRCYHLIARNAERQPIGTVRLSPEGKIGRMAVLPNWRGQGVGRSLLQAMIEKAHALGLSKISAHAQLSALAFYQRYGFVPEGEAFLEAGIPHQAVSLKLQARSRPVRPQPKPRSASIEAVRLNDVDSTLVASQHLIGEARGQLCIYTPDLEYALYGQKDVAEALKQFVLRSRNGEVRIIIQDPVNLLGQAHPVLELAQKLTSYFLLRTPLEPLDHQNLSAYLVNDTDGYLFRLLGNRYEGHWSPQLPSRNRQLREEFERVWQRSRPCTEFRALGL